MKKEGVSIYKEILKNFISSILFLFIALMISNVNIIDVKARQTKMTTLPVPEHIKNLPKWGWHQSNTPYLFVHEQLENEIVLVRSKLQEYLAENPTETKLVIPDYAFGYRTTVVCYDAEITPITKITSLEIRGDRLKNIGRYAFAMFPNLTTISQKFHEFESIGDYAFYGTGITTVNCVSPWSSYNIDLTSIGDYAFANCTNLREVNILNAPITRIGQYAFYNCTSLTKVVLNKDENNYGRDGRLWRLEEIGAYAFANCTKLTELTIPKSTLYYGENIADRNLQIGECFVKGSGVNRVIIEHRNTSFSSNSFKDASNLEFIYIDYDDNIPFNNFPNLMFDGLNSRNVYLLINRLLPENLDDINTMVGQSIKLDKKVTELGSDLNHYLSGQNCYMAEDKYEYGNTRSTLSWRSLYSCAKYPYLSNQQSGSIEIGLDFDRNYLQQHPEITSITIPATWGEAYGQYGREYKVIGVNLKDYGQPPINNTITHITVEEGVKELNSYVFNNLTNLQSVSLPQSLTNLDRCFQYSNVSTDMINLNNLVNLEMIDTPFKGCEKITSLDINGLNKLKYFGHKESPNLRTVSITTESSRFKILREAFLNCVNLTEVTIQANNSEMNIEPSAFSGCTNLSTVNLEIPNLKNIYYNAFSNCKNLTTLNITSNKLCSIQYDVFYNCLKLKTLEIPTSNETLSIWGDAFARSGITNLIINSANVMFYETTFRDVTHLRNLYFKSDSTQPFNSLPRLLFKGLDNSNLCVKIDRTIPKNPKEKELNSMVGAAVKWRQSNAELEALGEISQYLSGENCYMKNENGEWIQLFTIKIDDGNEINTIIGVRVRKDTIPPERLSITVPTSLAILVHAANTPDAASKPVDVYIGGGQHNTPGEASGNLKFLNSSTQNGTPIDCVINSVDVYKLGSTWTLDESSPSSAYHINMQVNGDALNKGVNPLNIILNKATGSSSEGAIYSTTTLVPVKIAIGGNSSEYIHNTTQSPQFNLNWKVSKS